MSRFYSYLILPKLILPILLLLMIPVFSASPHPERAERADGKIGAADAVAALEDSDGVLPAIAKTSADTFLIVGYDDDSHYARSILLVRLDREHSTLRSVQVSGSCYIRDEACPDGRLGSAFAEGYKKASSGGADEKSSKEAGISVLCGILQKTLGVGVRGSVCLGFDTFRTIVDKVSGVDIVLPEAYTCTDGLSLHAGSNHLSGREAVRFVRYGESDGTINPQKLFLTALLKKVKKEFSLTKAISLGSYVYRRADTDLGLSELLSLIRSALSIKPSEARIAELTGVKIEIEGQRVQIVNRNWARDLVNYYLDAGMTDDAFDPGERMTDPGNAEIEEIYRGRAPGMNGWGGAYNIPTDLKAVPFCSARSVFRLPASLRRPPIRRSGGRI